MQLETPHEKYWEKSFSWEKRGFDNVQWLTSICSKDLKMDRSNGRALSRMLLVPTGPLEPHIWPTQGREKNNHRVRPFILGYAAAHFVTWQKKGMYDLEVAQPAGEIQNVSQVGPGVTVTAGGFGQAKLLGDGKKLQRTKWKHLTGLQQLLACNRDTQINQKSKNKCRSNWTKWTQGLI